MHCLVSLSESAKAAYNCYCVGMRMPVGGVRSKHSSFYIL